jgi:cytochrome c
LVRSHYPGRTALAAAILALLSSLLGTNARAATADDNAAAFARCAGCHSTQPGETKIGPSLSGVFGRTSGSAPGFNYSPALKSANIVWNAQTLDKFLQNPNGFVHGVRMFVTVPNPDDRQSIIAYLKSLSPQAAQRN